MATPIHQQVLYFLELYEKEPTILGLELFAQQKKLMEQLTFTQIQELAERLAKVKETSSLTMALKSLHCFDLFGRYLSLGDPCSGIRPETLYIILLRIPWIQDARIKAMVTSMVKYSLKDLALSAVLRQGHMPAAIILKQLSPNLQRKVGNALWSQIQVAELDKWLLGMVYVGGPGILFQAMLRRYKSDFRSIYSDSSPFDEIISKVLTMPVGVYGIPGDWDSCWGLLRFTKILIEEIPEEMAQFAPKDWRLTGMNQAIISNLHLLKILHPKVGYDDPQAIVVVDGVPAMAIVDFFLAATRNRIAFMEEAGRGMRLEALRKQIRATIRPIKDNPLESDSIIIGWMLKTDTYRLLRLWSDQRQYPHSFIEDVLSQFSVSVLAAAQLIHSTNPGALSSSRMKSWEMNALVKIWNVLVDQPRIVPCTRNFTSQEGEEREEFILDLARLRVGLTADGTPNVLRGALLLLSGLELEETLFMKSFKDDGTLYDPISMREYGGFMNTLIERSCGLSEGHPAVRINVKYDERQYREPDDFSESALYALEQFEFEPGFKTEANENITKE